MTVGHREVTVSAPQKKRRSPEFSSTDHLGVQAVASFVDGELPPVAHRRATAHLLACSECRHEVARQRQAARRLRDSGNIHIPAELRSRLASFTEGEISPNGPDASHLDRRTPKSVTAALELTLRQLRNARMWGPRP
ncbi:zf-HC2 domain-containing protein [Corynebacterium sp. TAE3-ERU12]|uniref:zf-HC2 domain-containing protein n=1 Tax=Corynebacterium sp. TAE3-ERU12 TaxID=2849491 RepID=UPI001C43F0FE|nr:zf-HC2 domain-containing protein [Corynebacterium sp. TAE3-ERU12]MBV7295063.1 zf-HC2 domain-containing protein [Corynebacterium sp. TAE3-ERU12]